MQPATSCLQPPHPALLDALFCSDAWKHQATRRSTQRAAALRVLGQTTVETPARLVYAYPGWNAPQTSSRWHVARNGQHQAAGAARARRALAQACATAQPPTGAAAARATSAWREAAEKDWQRKRNQFKLDTADATRSYLVDPASSHMLVSKIKPCMSKYKPLYGETANGSLNQ